MNVRTGLAVAALGLVALPLMSDLGARGAATGGVGVTREEANAALIAEIAAAHGLSAAQKERVSAIFAASEAIGQGNPSVTRHPMSVAECQQRESVAGVSFKDAASERICGGPYMAPLYDPATQKPSDATSCIDQLEVPDIPCAYPVVWTRASEAADLCEAMGKRMCDAHEWEGACEGALEPPDYDFALVGGRSTASAQNRMRSAHNADYRADASHTWSYGPDYRLGVCGTGSVKTAGCNGGDWRGCGSNTYPAGAFPECKSALGVYDLNGNAAEHMNLPLAPDQMASAGSDTLGVTEMKGSWFIFDKVRAHEDWCRWRAPYWHGSKVEDPASHRNYHLGFRCCKSLDASSYLGPIEE